MSAPLPRRPGGPVVSAAPGRDILDVGCGTDIAARQFQAAGCRVLAIEPDHRVVEVAGRLSAEAAVATSEAWEPVGREFDAVVSATAWHWIDPAAGAAKTAQFLRPGSRLAAFWNVFQMPPELAEAVARTCRRVMPDAPFGFEAMTRKIPDACQAVHQGRRRDQEGGRVRREPAQW
ncbi:class I SAM-dependent methyltransferase [Streptomyces sp. NPDC006743]|uniref:class I SAM-dependent methyltransferase n=1 Tax=Streptomyces sp. NPDC006743 TaxID=3154480 RepID=UPI0034566F4E